MRSQELHNDRFIVENGFRIVLQVPDTHSERVIQAVLESDRLKYGDYDRVTYRTRPGTQTFRSLEGGRNRATEDALEVPCLEVSFFIEDSEARSVIQTLKAIYASHPYEEPVIFVIPCFRTRHIRGIDEDNPNKFWNSTPEDWVPEEHR